VFVVRTRPASPRFARTCQQLGIKHIFTRPYTPRTNGKAERFIQTSLREWANYAQYDHSGARLAALAPWLHHYNWHRLYYSLNLEPPASRLQLATDNVLRLHRHAFSAVDHEFCPALRGCKVFEAHGHVEILQCHKVFKLGHGHGVSQEGVTRLNQ
jgi:hypothetical protein